ncbi:MAG TPA: tetratricopeptide repeat protein, partial [Labilithrix sp.]|nr:tetratricopeptide repeat protein [Labilithrix sp.]
HRLEKAKTYYGRALELRKASLGSQNPRIGIMEHNLAVTLAELGLRDEALVHVRAAVAIRENTLPPDHHWRRESEALLAELIGLAPGARRLRH